MLKNLFKNNMLLFLVLNVASLMAQNCGIGTTTPTNTLSIVDNGSTAGIDINANYSGNANPIIEFKLQGTTKFIMGCDDTDNDNFEIGNTNLSSNWFVIKPDGNVGIGIANPASHFLCSASDATKIESVFENTNAGGDISIGFMTNASRRFTMGVSNSDDAFKIGISSVNTGTLFRITSTGSVGIGTLNPSTSKFEISGSGTDGGLVLIVRDDATTTTGEVLGRLSFSDIDGSKGTSPAEASCTIASLTEEGHSSTTKGANLRFCISANGRDENVNATAKMEIQEDGQVGIGVTGATVDHLLHLVGAARATNANFDTSSDIRVKKNIKNVKNGLDVVMKLHPVSFDWKKDYRAFYKELPKHDIGFIAQEVEKIIPSTVKTNKEIFGKTTIQDFKVLNKGQFSPIIVNAIQEQQKMIEEKTERIKMLQEQQAALNSELLQLESMLNN